MWVSTRLYIIYKHTISDLVKVYRVYRHLYVYSHAHTDIIHMHIFTYIRESLQMWTHGMCTQRVCSIIFHFQKWRSTVPAEMLHTISYIPTYIHTYILSVNKYDICRHVCDKADPSVGAGVIQWHRVDTVACYEFITQGKGRENGKRCHRREFTRS